MKKIDQSLLNKVISEAQESDRKRMNYNFHDSMDENMQRMLNALEPETYLPPHRHLNPAKEEVFLVLSGRVLLLEFDDEGNVIDHMLIDPQNGSYAAEVAAGVWHTLISLESGTVIYEVKQGPFSPISPNNLAPWAPAPNDSEKHSEYLEKLRNSVLM